MKIARVILVVLLIMSLLPVSFALAQSEGEAGVILDGAGLVLKINPQFFDGELTVPVNSFSEAAGAKISRDSETNAVTIQKAGSILIVDAEHVYTEEKGKLIRLDVPLYLYKGVTMVPLSFLADSWSLDMQWDEKRRVAALESLKIIRYERFNDKDKDSRPAWVSKWVESAWTYPDIQYRILDNRLYILATYGEKATGGYDVHISKVMFRERDNAIIVPVEYKDVSFLPTIQVFTMPYDLVYIDLDPDITPSELIFRISGLKDAATLPQQITIGGLKSVTL